MLNVYAIRRQNLRHLSQQWGGPASLSRKLGHSNASYLAQLIGPHPSREISEKVAREMEAKLGLPGGWMDIEHGPSRPVDDAALADAVRAVAAALRDAGLRPEPDRYATLVALAFEHARLTGRLDETHINKLISLMR
jgi:hypothetical protein